jgi:hypothetical protein
MFDIRTGEMTKRDVTTDTLVRGQAKILTMEMVGELLAGR